MFGGLHMAGGSTNIPLQTLHEIPNEESANSLETKKELKKWKEIIFLALFFDFLKL